MRFVDLTGKRFNYLTVVAFERKGKNYKSYWRAKCDCGKETVVQGYKLTSGQTKSCGCYNHFLLNSGSRKKHGMSKTPIYSTWLRMISRCHNEKDKRYSFYGERGISVCDEWKNSFDSFYDWAIKNGYKETKNPYELTIDRIDNNKGYYPENCRWVNMTIQSNNTRKNVHITYNGETLTIAEAARKYNMPYKTLHKRIRTFGWSVIDAIETKVGEKRRE